MSENFIYGNGTNRLYGVSDTIDSASSLTVASTKCVNNIYNNLKELIDSKGGGLPLGHIYLWPFSTPPDGSIQLNGSTYSRELYSDLWALIQEKGWYKSESEWQSIASANGGYCPWYSDGDGSTTFRTPKFAPYQKLALASGDAGKYYEAGLPNITGSLYTQARFGEGTGAIYTNGSGLNHQTTTNMGYSHANLDASRSNSIYGNSTTVQPESNDWIICAVAYGTATNVGSVDVANVMSAVSQVQADLVNLESSINKQTIYKKIAERSSTGNWTITGCTIGRPLKIYLTYPNVDDYSEVDLTVVSGSDVAKMTRPFAVGFGGNWASTDIFEVIPTESTVVIKVGGSIGPTGKLLAYN